jgi:hypothetical protein
MKNAYFFFLPINAKRASIKMDAQNSQIAAEVFVVFLFIKQLVRCYLQPSKSHTIP